MAERFPWCLRSNLAWFGGMISRNSLMPWFFFASWSCSDLLWLLLFYSGLCVRPCFLVSRAHTCVHYSKMISPIRWYYGIPESKYQHSPYFKKSMLVNHNDIHALNQQLLKVMYIFKTIFHQATVDPFHHILVVGWVTPPTHQQSRHGFLVCRGIPQSLEYRTSGLGFAQYVSCWPEETSTGFRFGFVCIWVVGGLWGGLVAAILLNIFHHYIKTFFHPISCKNHLNILISIFCPNLFHHY